MKAVFALLLACCIVMSTTTVFAAEQPAGAVSIAKENTYRNAQIEMTSLKPKSSTTSLLETTDVPIHNLALLQQLNESSWNRSKLSFGFKGSIYLGSWPLSYTSTSSEIDWKQEKINMNMLDNRGGASARSISHTQQQQKQAKALLTEGLKQKEMVMQLLLRDTQQRTKVPLGTQAVVGFGTEAASSFSVAPGQIGYLYAYLPTVAETGTITYGEVYISIEHGEATLDIQDVTEVAVQAQLPIQNMLFLELQQSKQPR
ncbi:hypothetical protein FLK61_27940 [Paenalkalicoccus suaedae]|uniref:YfkD-like protein n=1 Tax=Paenalkalicoccus suaedae TaxID=2592382 RepID=A0A859FED0_9BACI|nr:YfkD family protein [Paenalkalicoccus suaedae]QKS70585.1 hypothetical protein FLK61_27940 [Paenalkalicoccus suaedae]